MAHVNKDESSYDHGSLGLGWVRVVAALADVL